MRRRKRRRTMRSEEPRRADEDDQRLCLGGVCAVRRLPDVEVPTAFNHKDMGKHLRCSEDGLTINYDGPGDDDKDACSVRTHCPVPRRGVALYYFEITVVDAGSCGNIGVGLCEKGVKLEKMPGWESGSFGYHGDDGLVFQQSGQPGNKYGPKYSTGDTVGCCWDMVEGFVFFTRNGEFLGRAFDGLKNVLYPTVGMQTKGGRLTANFGANEFRYNIEDYARSQRERVVSAVRVRSLPHDIRLLEKTVLGYLIHSGYAGTAAAFARDSGKTEMLDKERDAMIERQAVCASVSKGEIDAAMKALGEKFPTVLQQSADVAFLLHTQKFIEMIVGGAGPEETVWYGKNALSEFRKTKEEEQTLEQVYSLLAYVNPKTSPNGDLCSQERRDMVARRLNAAILKSQGREMRSNLERLVCHTQLVLDEAMKHGNGPFALVTVKDFL